MSNSYNIIGDIAGQYDTLLALLDKMPEGAPVSVGDMVDRGPKSKEVLEFFKDNGLAVLGNHDHMMVDSCKYGGKFYVFGDWFWNGGVPTIESFFPEIKFTNENRSNYKERLYLENAELLDWVDSLPLYLELDGAFISHAVKRPDWTLELCCRLGAEFDGHVDNTLIWNRGTAKRMDGLYQICGHNSHWGLKQFTDKAGEFGICLDTSRKKILTGMHWPSREIFQQEYLK